MADRCNCGSGDDGCLPWPLMLLLAIWIVIKAIGGWRDEDADRRLDEQIVTECARAESPARCAREIREAIDG